MSTNLLSRIKQTHSRKPAAIYLRVKKKLTYLKSNMKTRTDKTESTFDVTNEQLEELVASSYNTRCTYCSTPLTYKNYVCDHIVPLSRGGHSTIDNLQIICKRCNTQKGPLFEHEFMALIVTVATFTEESARYVKRKLSKAGI